MKRFTILVCMALLLFTVPGVHPAYADDENRYTVRRGDTLLELAARFGVAASRLAAANGLRWNAWVYIGQEIVIPSGALAGPAPAPRPATEALYSTDPRVPDPIPQLPVLLREQPATVVPFTYARVVQDDVPVYGSPDEAARGLPPKRRLGLGYVWVSVESKATSAGQDYYQINPGEFVPAEALSFYHPSRFQGVALAEQPERPFAWILKPVQPVLEPGGEVNPEAPVYQRYELVQIFATEHIGDQVWYLIGPHQWINQIYVGKVEPSTLPEDIESGVKWIAVDLFEQTLAAYEGDRLVYATLVSSGLRGWDTPPGVFKVWLKLRSGKMSGGYGRPDYYFLEDVPWTMYFNRDIALHTAYWHDGFGYRHSHGCVNLAPVDAKWLFEWAPDDVWVQVY